MRLLGQELAEGTFPQWLSQLALPFGFGLISVHFFLRLLRDLDGTGTYRSAYRNWTWEIRDLTVEGHGARILNPLTQSASGNSWAITQI